MNQTTIVSVVAALIIGFAGGHYIAGKPAETTGMHVMPDGTSMADQMNAMTTGLAGKSGDEFDKTFISEMIVHHEGAVDMAELALQSAKHTEVKQLAQDIIAAQTREIATMRGWLQSWYGN